MGPFRFGNNNTLGNHEEMISRDLNVDFMIGRNKDKDDADKGVMGQEVKGGGQPKRMNAKPAEPKGGRLEV